MPTVCKSADSYARAILQSHTKGPPLAPPRRGIPMNYEKALPKNPKLKCLCVLKPNFAELEGL